MGWTLKAVYLGCTCLVQSFSSDSSSLRDQSLVTGVPGGLLRDLSLLGTSSVAAAGGDVPRSESMGSPTSGHSVLFMCGGIRMRGVTAQRGLGVSLSRYCSRMNSSGL